MKPYSPLGLIEQEPSCKRTYHGRNPADGRKIPVSSIGAARRPLRTWESGLHAFGYLRLRLTIIDNQLTLRIDPIG